MKWFEADLGAVSGGSGGRAAGILVLAHLVPGLIMAGLWSIGLLSIFDDRRWIPVSVTAIFGTVAVVALFLGFGFWGTPATHGVGSGEDYTTTFTPGVGFGLGWLRWFLQIVLVVAVLATGFMTWANVRAWHLFGTEELRELDQRAAAIPVPEDWTLSDTDASGFGIPEFMDGPEGPEPQGFVKQTFVVPDSYAYTDLVDWLDSSEWADNPDGVSFGAIEREQCERDTGRCDVRLVPPPGEQPEYFVRAQLDEPSDDGDQPEVEVRLDYRQYVTPDWDVSPDTVERAMSIPTLPDWVQTNVIAGTTINGESFTQFFGVPESFTRDDLDAWLAGPLWTTPSDGDPFGEIEVDAPCREVGPGELDRTYLCSAIVVGTKRSPSGGSSAGPIESLSVSLDADSLLRVSLARNG